MKHSTITTREFIQKITRHEVNVLTLEKAKKLHGKKIAWAFFDIRGRLSDVYETRIGEVVTSWDYNKNVPVEGYESQTDEWEKTMTEREIEEEKNTFILLNREGKDNDHLICYDNYISCFNEPTFVCEEIGNEVYYIELDDVQEIKEDVYLTHALCVREEDGSIHMLDFDNGHYVDGAMNFDVTTSFNENKEYYWSEVIYPYGTIIRNGVHLKIDQHLYDTLVKQTLINFMMPVSDGLIVEERAEINRISREVWKL